MINVSPVDPIRTFEHTHDELTELALGVGAMVRLQSAASGQGPRTRLFVLLESLRDQLLRHFALEEEGLFPFVRANMPANVAAVDRLAHAHDAICGTVVRLAHLARTTPPAETSASLVELHARFEAAYAQHAREEAALFKELAVALDERQRNRLAQLLGGL